MTDRDLQECIDVKAHWIDRALTAEQRIETLERELKEATQIAHTMSVGYTNAIAYLAEVIPGLKKALGEEIPDWEQRLAEVRRLNKMAKKR